MDFKYIDLCAGTGGFSYSLKNLNNFKCVFANDICKESEQIYKINFPNHNFVSDDLLNINADIIPSHDLCIAGFSCQPFSIAGKQLGFEDARSNIFWKILEIIEYHKPKIVLLENVKNLTTHDDKKSFNIILENLENLNYNIKYKILDTSKITKIPQHRERIYIIGFLDKNMYDNFNFDFQKVDTLNIVEFLEKDIPNKYYYNESNKIYKTLFDNILEDIDNNSVYQYRRHYVRKNKSNLIPTLTANMGTGGHNVPIIKDKIGIRKLTPRECFNLQGFKEDYILPKISDNKLYKLCGNAISIDIPYMIFQKIEKLIKF